MRGYHEELCTRLRTIGMMIASGVKIKKKIICNAMHEASIAIQEIQSIEAKLNELEKENLELRRQLEVRIMTTNQAGD